jgi:hypothetical protein
MKELVSSILILGIIVCIHILFWRRFVYKVSETRSVWRIAGTIIAIGSWALITLALVSSPYGAPIAILDSVAYVGTVWSRNFLLIIILVLIIDVVRFFLKRIKSSTQETKSLQNKSARKIYLFVFTVAVIVSIINIITYNKTTTKIDLNNGISGSLPFQGRWIVGNSPAQEIPSHGTYMFGVGYAIDFIAVNDQNRTSETTSWRSMFSTENPDVFYAFGQPVLSPVSGTIVDAHNGEPDHKARRSLVAHLPYILGEASRINDGVDAIAGNYVIIKPDKSDVYIGIVHLQLDSVQVTKGQHISKGEHIGNCGNSGNSTQPHIHIQAMDSTDLSIAKGVPLYFDSFSSWNSGKKDWIRHKKAIPDADSVVTP